MGVNGRHDTALGAASQIDQVLSASGLPLCEQLGVLTELIAVRIVANAAPGEAARITDGAHGVLQDAVASKIAARRRALS